MKTLRRQTSEASTQVEILTIDRNAVRVAPMLPYRAAATTFYQRRGKRLLDFVLGTVLFVGCLPIMAVVALAVLMTSGWPVLYRGDRVGRNGQPLRIWKFRTMIRDADEVLHHWKTADAELAAEHERDFKLRDDPRVTALGRFLRKSSLDELPQLWNVICGEMSLVGPRPVVEKELSKYGGYAQLFLSVQPGVTGSWQVNGRNGVTYPERVLVELAYCRSVTLLGDLAILVRTLAAPFRNNGI